MSAALALRWPVVLFDLDGTIVDSSIGIVQCVRQALQLRDIDVESDVVRAHIGLDFQTMFPQLGVRFDDIDSCIADFRRSYSDGGLFEAEPYSGAREAIVELHEQGARIGLATTKAEVFASRLMAHLGFDNYFETVCGASYDGTRRHKDDIIIEALTCLDASPADAVMIGDRDLDLVGARSVGIASIGVTWGFGALTELQAAGPEAIVGTFAELMNALFRAR